MSKGKPNKRRSKAFRTSASAGEKIKIIDGKGSVIASFIVPKGQGVTLRFEPELPMDTPSKKLTRDICAYFNAAIAALEDLAEIDIAAAEDAAEYLGISDLFDE